MRPSFEVIDANKLTGFDRVNWLALQVCNGLRYHSGITIGLDFYRPSSGYALSLYKASELKIEGIPDQYEVIRFIDSNLDLLSCNCNFIGAWFNEGSSYLDIATIIEDRGRAVQLAKSNGQLAIFDLEKKENIYL